MSFAGSIGLAGLVIALAGAAGIAAAAALLPNLAALPERSGWGMFLGLAAIGAAEGLMVLLRLSPTRAGIALLAVLFAAVACLFRLPAERKARPDRRRSRILELVFAILLIAGVLLYLLRATTEPMWSNDFLAIWGLKGKAVFLARGLPDWPLRSADAGFSHPEYPIGLPLLYAGFSTLLGRWDDHGMALLFPAFQLATLAALLGWLRRREVEAPVALAAAAVLALFEPLYSGFLTGMAEVPLSGAMLLLATSWSDALDGTDTGAIRRVAVASVLAASLKNEGFFFAVVAGMIGAVGLAAASSRSRRLTAACVLPSAAVYGVHRAVLGTARLRDFDAGLLQPDRLAELPGRIVVALTAAWEVAIRPAWPGLLCIAALLIAGRRCPAGDRILVLAALMLAAYLVAPVFAMRGPDWLVRTTLTRTAAALAPVVAAGLATRVGIRPAEPGAV